MNLRDPLQITRTTMDSRSQFPTNEQIALTENAEFYGGGWKERKLHLRWFLSVIRHLLYLGFLPQRY